MSALTDLFPRDGVVRIDCTRWWIVQLILDWNRKGFLPTLEAIRRKLKEQTTEKKINYYLGLGRSLDSVLQSYTKQGYVGCYDCGGGQMRYYVTPNGVEVLNGYWDNEDARKYFFVDKSIIPERTASKRAI